MKFAWSFSSLSDYLNCPLQYYKVRVSKEIPREETEAMRYGTITHKHLEDRLVEKAPLPEHLTFMERFVRKLETSDGEPFAEQKMAIDDKFEPVDWFDKKAWCRAIVDVGLRTGEAVWQGDYKTGKRKPGSDQLMLSAALRMHSDPEVEYVSTSYIWLKDRKMDSGGKYPRSELPNIWKHFLPRIARLEAAYEKNAWPAKPSGLCPWCPVTKAHCKFSKHG